MKFGIREVCDVALRAKAKTKLGSRVFLKGEPVLYFDSLKSSSVEGAATTVYAAGGRGNAQLIAWEGERTLTFTMEDALISPEGLAILTGADLLAAKDCVGGYVFQHVTDTLKVETAGVVVLEDTSVAWKEAVADAGDAIVVNKDADIFVMKLDAHNEIDSEPHIPTVSVVDGKVQLGLECLEVDDYVFVDYYVARKDGAYQIEITADKFAGNYYLEGSTLFRDEATGLDMPAEFIIPNGKIQSNFTFAMASSGDPSTFTFVMDAFPDYTRFDRTKKVLCAIQVIYDAEGEDEITRNAGCTTLGE